MPMITVASDYFHVSLKQTSPTIIITVSVVREDVTTTDMPYIAKLLQKELPTILRSQCFNENNMPFYQEVLSTELGHLFEHILLEYLCIGKINVGFDEAIFSGITKWDWNKDPYGTFHIELSMEKDDHIFLQSALQKTTHLFEKILLFDAFDLPSQAAYQKSSFALK